MYGLSKNTFLRLRHVGHNRKCKSVFMMHNFNNTESWEGKANNKLSDSKLASPPISLVLQFLLEARLKAEHLHITVAVGAP